MEEQELIEVFQKVKGSLRLVKEQDGFYIIGEGMYLAVRSYEEGIALIDDYKNAYKRMSI